MNDPYSTPPSGVTTGDDVDKSETCPAGNSFVAEYFVAANGSPNVLLNTLLVTAIGNHLSVGDIFCSHRTTFTVGTRRIDFNVGPQLTNPNRGGVNPAGIL